jgi:lysophospholipase L1-like esterase
VSTSNNSYFGKAILFVALSVAAFLVFKEVLPERLFSEHVEVNENILMDSMALMAQSDTTEIHDTPVIESDSAKTQAYEEVDAHFNPVLTADGYQNLNRFYTKLRELQEAKTGKVRIAYFGDSMNDGDYIVQDIRSEFQENYGGEGVGYVAVSSLSAGARGSISHQYSKNWFSQSFVKVKKPMKPFGIDGQVFFAKDPGQTYWVRYKARLQKHSTQLNNPVLLYGRGNNNKAYVTVAADKDSVSSKSLNPVNLLNTLSLSSHNAKSMQVDFHNADSIPVYGFNFDNGEGVHVDNFSIRGNSGLPLSILNPSLMNAFDKVLNYDLIILHYGANVLGYGSLNYNWYERNMTTVVNNLHECFPNADILVISTADRALKIDGTMQTDPAVAPLANAQRNYARKTNSGFISLYEAMGSKGSMITWVNNKLANKDYTHFNSSGSKKVAKLIYTEIDKGYAKFKAKQ